MSISVHLVSRFYIFSLLSLQLQSAINLIYAQSIALNRCAYVQEHANLWRASSIIMFSIPNKNILSFLLIFFALKHVFLLSFPSSLFFCFLDNSCAFNICASYTFLLLIYNFLLLFPFECVDSVWSYWSYGTFVLIYSYREFS